MRLFEVSTEGTRSRLFWVRTLKCQANGPSQLQSAIRSRAPVQTRLAKRKGAKRLAIAAAAAANRTNYVTLEFLHTKHTRGVAHKTQNERASERASESSQRMCSRFRYRQAMGSIQQHTNTAVAFLDRSQATECMMLALGVELERSFVVEAAQRDQRWQG